jgi:hypothetical protein
MRILFGQKVPKCRSTFAALALLSTLAMMKFVFALVLATASANFVQLGRTTAGSGGDTNDRRDWVDVTFPTAFTSTVRENEPAPFF